MVTLYLLSRERADQYAALLGLPDMGFSYSSDGWGSMVYTACLPVGSIKVYLTQADRLSATDKRISVEIEWDGLWFQPQEKPDSSLEEIKLRLVQRLVHLKYEPAIPFLRAHKIDGLFSHLDS